MNKYLKIFLWTLGSLVLIIGLGTALLFTASVQSFIARRVTAAISENIPQQINISRVKISPFGGVELDDVYVADHRNDTLIYVPSARADVGLFGIIIGKFNIKSLTLVSPEIRVCRYQGESEDSFALFLRNFKKSGDKKPFELRSSYLSVENATLSYQNFNHKEPKYRRIQNLNIKASDIFVSADTYRGQIETIDLSSNMNFLLKHFKGYFSFSPSGILVDDFSMQSGGSAMEGSFAASFDAKDTTLAQKIARSEFNLRLDKAEVTPSEFAFLYPRLETIPKVNLSTVVQGKVDDIEILKLKLFSPNTISLNAYGKLLKGTDLKHSKGHIILVNLSTAPAELYRIFSVLTNKQDDKKLISTVQNLEYLNGSGILDLDVDKASAALQLSSGRGNVSLNASAQNIWDKRNVFYSFDLTMMDLNVGALSSIKNIGALTGYVKGSGVGIDKKVAQGKFNANLSSAQVNGYRYSDLSTEGQYAPSDISISIKVNDPNLEANLNARLSSLAKGGVNLKADLYLDKSNLNALGIVKDSASVNVRATLHADLSAKNIDDALGTISMSEISYSYGDKYYYVDRIQLESVLLSDGRKKLTLESSDLLNAKIEGKYILSEVGAVIKNGVLGRFHSYQKKKVRPGQKFDFELDVVAQNVKVVNTPILFDGQTTLKGSANSTTESFTFEMDAHRINYSNLLIDTLSVRMNTESKNYALIKAKKFINPFYSVQNVDLKVDKVSDSLFISTDFYKWRSGDTIAYHIKAYQREDSAGNVIVRFLPSNIDLERINWQINGQNPKRDRLVWNPSSGSIRVDSLGIESGAASFYVDGYYTSDRQMDIKLTAKAVDFSKVMFLRNGERLQGMLSGYLSLTKGKQDKSIIPRALFSIDGIAIDKDKIGDLIVSVDADLPNKRIKTFVSLRKDSRTELLLTGGLDIGQQGLMSDMNLKLDRLNIAPLHYLLPSVFNTSRGLASGQIHVFGMLRDMDMEGDVSFDSTVLGVNFTKVEYSMPDGTVVPVRGNEFLFENIKVKDVLYSTTATLDCKLSHNKFSSWFVDLDVKADNTLALNTSSRDNERFYGRLFGTGSFSLKGNVKSLTYDIDALMTKNSVFSIDIGRTSDFQASTMIQFVPPKTSHVDSLLQSLKKRIDKQNTVSSSQVNMNVRVNTDSQINVILDNSSGHMIQAQGSGLMRMNLSRKGVFDMTGTYQVSSGEYTFVYRELIKRPFSLVPGGKLIFDGNPSNPEIDFSATYKNTTKPGSFLSSVNENAREEVLMTIYLSNNLMNPVYTFNITMPKAPENVREELAYRLSDQEQLNQQFISLMVLNSFSNTGQDTGNQNMIATGVAGLTAGMLSNQFSNVVQRFVSGVDIDLNLGTGVNKYTGMAQSTDLEVGISTKLFDDRVTVNGVVGVPTGSTQSNLVGDVEIEYSISRDGRLRGRFVNRSQDDYMTNQQGYMQSLGLSYRQEFDSFKELGQIISKAFKKKVNKSKKGVSTEK